MRRTTQAFYEDRGGPYRIVERLNRVDIGRPPTAVLTEIAGTVSRALRLPQVELQVGLPLGQLEAVTRRVGRGE